MDINFVHGDCLSQSWPKCSIFILDPPYGIEFQSARRPADERFDVIAGDDNLDFMWLERAEESVVEPAAMLCFCRWDVQQRFYEALSRYWRVRSQVIWDRGVHGLGDLEAQFAPCHDVIWFATKGNYKFPGHRPKSVYRVDRVPANELLHPTQKPLPLIEIMINDISSPGQLIIDPFMGSGTTGIACERKGRNFWGCEINERYYKVAQKRLAQQRAQYSLF